MINKRRSIRKDKRAFTGLEAAIVLTAFIVVAAVFSYMVLGAGFFSTEKAKAVVHTGIEQATSSAELVGDVIGKTNDTGAYTIKKINFTIQLTAGQHPLDLNKSTISFANSSYQNDSLIWDVTELAGGDNDYLLEANEKAEIQVNLPSAAYLGTYNKFQLEFKPDAGGVLVISRTTPGAISNVTRLY